MKEEEELEEGQEGEDQKQQTKQGEHRLKLFNWRSHNVCQTLSLWRSLYPLNTMSPQDFVITFCCHSHQTPQNQGSKFLGHVMGGNVFIFYVKVIKCSAHSLTTCCQLLLTELRVLPTFLLSSPRLKPSWGLYVTSLFLSNFKSKSLPSASLVLQSGISWICDSSTGPILSTADWLGGGAGGRRRAIPLKEGYKAPHTHSRLGDGIHLDQRKGRKLKLEKYQGFYSPAD